MTAEKQTPQSNSGSMRPWYRFFDGNKKYDYKSLYNAVTWAQRKVQQSTSEEIRIFRVCKKKRGLEIDNIVRVRFNRPSRSRTIIGLENESVVLDPTNGSITTAWRDIYVYNEYKEKEQWVSSQDTSEIYDFEDN